jgi:hypothetical protein
MAELRKQIADLMRRVRTRGNLPSSKAIVDEAFKQLDFGKLQPDEVLTRFNELLRRFWQHPLIRNTPYQEKPCPISLPNQPNQPKQPKQPDPPSLHLPCVSTLAVNYPTAKAGGLPSPDEPGRVSGPVDSGPPSRRTV